MTSLNYIGSWASIMGGTIALFGIAEVVAKADIKDRIKKWLINTPPDSSEDKWARQFADLFDSIFGKRHFTIRCFVRSCIASIVAVLICSVFSLTLDSPRNLSTFLSSMYPEFKSILVFAVFTNFLADYLSLLESRFMLNILMKHYSKTKVIVILFLDILATVILWIIPAMLALFVITILFHHDVKISHLYDFMQSLIPTTFELVHMVIGLEDDKNPIFLRILLCSSFFTSVWLWLYLIGGGVIKLWSSFNKGRITLFSKLNIANYPVTSIGFVVCLVITIGFILGAPFALR